jgi:hypothetical protein
MSIEKLIGDLLLRHNCVVVPSFGGFVAKQTPASIDKVHGIMLPPKKSLLFNRQLINNDGLLIASFAKEMGVTFDEAANSVQALVEIWSQALNEGERVVIDKVGFLFLDQEKNIGFEQDRYFNLLLHSFGLGTVHFVSEEDIQLVNQPVSINPQIVHEPIAAQKIRETPIITLIPEGIEKVEEKITETPIISISAGKTNTSSLWRYAAVALLMPIAFYSYWIPMKTNVLESGIFAVQDFNPFHHASRGKYERKDFPIKLDKKNPIFISVEDEIQKLDANVQVWSYPFSDKLFIPIKIAAAPKEVVQAVAPQAVEAPIIEAPIIEAPIEKTKPVKTEVAYYLITNCFGSVSNAQNFVSFLISKGFDAQIVDTKNGLQRVSAGKSANAADLKSIQSQVEALDIQGSWILKK